MQENQEGKKDNPLKRTKPSRKQIESIQEEYNSVEKELKENYLEILKRRCDFYREKEEENKSSREIEEEERSIERTVQCTENLLKELIGEESCREYKEETEPTVKEYKEGRERIVEICNKLNQVTTN